MVLMLLHDTTTLQPTQHPITEQSGSYTPFDHIGYIETIAPHHMIHAETYMPCTETIHHNRNKTLWYDL